MSQWHSALTYNFISAQIAGLHNLHILVFYLLNSSTLWHRVLYCHQFLDMLLLCSESYHLQYVVFMKRIYLWHHSKWRSPLGWGLVIVVDIPLALVDLSTCWVIVHQETYTLLQHGMEELCLVERRHHHYYAVSVIVVTVSLSMLRYRSCATVVWKKNRSKCHFTWKTCPNYNPRLIQLSFYHYMGIFCWTVDTVLSIHSTWKFKMSFTGPHNFINDATGLTFVIHNHFAEL